MIPVLHIDRRAPGVYAVTTSRPEMREPEIVNTIAEGLKLVGDSMPRECERVFGRIAGAAPASAGPRWMGPLPDC